MKIIIEIPEKTNAHIRSDYGHGVKGLRDADREILCDAIYNGRPIKDITKVNQVIKLSITGKPLKPCPFCGSKKISMYDESVRDFFYEDERYLIECDRCSATIERYSITGVKRAWNRREGEKE